MKKNSLFVKALSVLLSVLVITSIFTVLPTSVFAAKTDTAAVGDEKEPSDPKDEGDGKDKDPDNEPDPTYLDARFYRGGKEYYGGKNGLTRFYQGDELTDISLRVFDDYGNDLTDDAEYIWMYSANQGMIQMYTPVGISADDCAETYRPLLGQSDEFWQYADENGGEWSYDLFDWGTMPNEQDFLPMVFEETFDGVSVTSNSTIPAFSRDEISDWYSGPWFTEQYQYTEEPEELRAHDVYSLAITAIVRYQKRDGSYLYAYGYGSDVTVTDELSISGSLTYDEDEWNTVTLADGDSVEFSSADESTGLAADNLISSTGLRYLWFWSATQPESVGFDTMTPVGMSAEDWNQYKEYLSGGDKPKDGDKGKDGEGGLSFSLLYQNFNQLWYDSAAFPALDYNDITGGHADQINEEDGIYLACAAVYPDQQKPGEGEPEEISLLAEGFICDYSISAKISSSAAIRFYEPYDMTYEMNRGETTAELAAGIKKAPEGEIAYQWYRVTDDGGVAVDGAVDNVYQAPIPEAGESVSYYCAASCGDVTGRSDNFTVSRTTEWNTEFMTAPIGDFSIAYNLNQFGIYPNISSSTYWSYIDPMKSLKVYRVTGDSYEGGTEVQSGYSGGTLYITDAMEQGETRRYYIYFKTTSYKEFRSDIFAVTKQVYHYDPTQQVKDIRVNSIFNPVPLFAPPEWRDSDSGIYQYVGAETYAYFFTEDTSTTYSLSDLTVDFYRCDNDDKTGSVTKLNEVTVSDLSNYPRVNDIAAVENGIKCLLPSDTAGAYYVYADYTATVEGETFSKTTDAVRVTVEDVSHEDYFRFDEETGTITGYYGYEDVVTYPAEINGVEVKRICTTELTDSGVRNNQLSLQGTYKTCLKAVLPEGLKEIAPYTFLGEKYLEEVTVSNSVTGIGRYCFYNCARLKSVTVGHYDADNPGSNLQTFEFGTFSKLPSLEQIDFSACYNTVRQKDDINGLYSVTVNSFTQVPKLTDFIAPENGMLTFGLASVFEPFHDAYLLKHIVNPTHISFFSFSTSCPHIYFMVRDGQEYSDYDENFVYYPDDVNNGWMIGGLMPGLTDVNKTIVFPDEFGGKKITGIGAGNPLEYQLHYWRYNKPEYVVLGEYVKSIGARAFQECETLIGVTLPQSLKSIGSHAFRGAEYGPDNKLTVINLNETQTDYIGEYAFYQQRLCDFGDLTFGAGAYIGKCAFKVSYAVTEERTDRLTSVTVNGSAHIGCQAFYGRFTLRTLDVSGSLKLDQDAFDECWFLETATYRGEIQDGEIIDESRGFSHLRYTPAAPKVTDTKVFLSVGSDAGSNVLYTRTYSRFGDYAYYVDQPVRYEGEGEEQTILPDGDPTGTLVLYLKLGEANIYIPGAIGEDTIDTVDIATAFAYIEAGHVIINSGEYEDGESNGADFDFELDSAYTYTLSFGDGIKTLNNRRDGVYLNLKNCTAVSLPNTLLKVPPYLFNNGQLTGVVEIPAGVTTVGEKAFARNRIDRLILHEGLTEIYRGAFASGDVDDSLYSRVTSDDERQIHGVTTPEKGVVEGENQLPDSLTTMDAYAFADCMIAGKLTLPKNLNTINDGVFFGNEITEVYSDGSTIRNFGSDLWSGDDYWMELVSVGVFGNCPDLRVIDLSEATIDTLEPLSFENSIYGNNIGKTSENLVNKVEVLKLPKALKKINFNALRGVDPALMELAGGLETYNVEYLSEKINGKPTSDYSITLPESVTAVHSSVFNLGEVTFHSYSPQEQTEMLSVNSSYDALMYYPETRSGDMWLLETNGRYVSGGIPAGIKRTAGSMTVFFKNAKDWRSVYVCYVKGRAEKRMEMTYLTTDDDGHDIYFALLPDETNKLSFDNNSFPAEAYFNSIEAAGKLTLTDLPASISENCTVRCYENSFIHNWCVANDISFELIPGAPTDLYLHIKGVDGRIFTPQDFDLIEWVDDTNGRALAYNTMACPVHELPEGHTVSVKLWMNDEDYAVYDIYKGESFTYDPSADNYSPVQEVILDKRGIAYVTGSFGDQIHIDGFSVTAYSIRNDESTDYQDVRTEYPVTVNPDGSFFTEVPKIAVNLEASVAESEPYTALTVRNIAYRAKGDDRRISLGTLTLPSEQIAGRIAVTNKIAGSVRVTSTDGSKFSEAGISISGNQYYLDLTKLRGVFEIGDEVTVIVGDPTALIGWEPYTICLPGEKSAPESITLTAAQNAKVHLPSHSYSVKLGAYDSSGRLFAYTTANADYSDDLYLPAGSYTLIAFQNSARGNITLTDTLAEFEANEYDIAGYAKTEVTLSAGEEYTYDEAIPGKVVNSAVTVTFTANPGLADKTTGSYPIFMRYSVDESARHGDVVFMLSTLSGAASPFVQIGDSYATFSGKENARFDVTFGENDHYGYDLRMTTDAYEGTVCFYVRPTGQPLKLFINGAYKTVYTVPANIFSLIKPAEKTTTLANSVTLKYTNAISCTAKVYVNDREASSLGLSAGAANKARLTYTLPETESSTAYRICVKVFDAEDKLIWESYNYTVTYTVTPAPIPQLLNIRVENYNASDDGVARVDNATYDFSTGEFKKMKLIVTNANFNKDGTIAKDVTFNYSLSVKNPELVAYDEIYLKVWYNEEDSSIATVTLTYNEATGAFEGKLCWRGSTKTVEDLPYGFDLDIPTERNDSEADPEGVEAINERGDLLSGELDPEVKECYEDRINLNSFRFLLENGEYIEDMSEEEKQAFRDLTKDDIDDLVNLAAAKNGVVDAYEYMTTTVVEKMQDAMSGLRYDDMNSFFEAQNINAIEQEVPDNVTEAKLLSQGYTKIESEYGTFFRLEEDDRLTLTCLDPRISYVYATNSNVIDSLKGKKNGKADLAATGDDFDAKKEFENAAWKMLDDIESDWGLAISSGLMFVSAVDIYVTQGLAKLTASLDEYAQKFTTFLNKYSGGVIKASYLRKGAALDAVERYLHVWGDTSNYERISVNGATLEIEELKGAKKIRALKTLAEGEDVSEWESFLVKARNGSVEAMKGGPKNLSWNLKILKPLLKGGALTTVFKWVPILSGVVGIFIAFVDLLEYISDRYDVLLKITKRNMLEQWFRLYWETLYNGDVFGLNLCRLPEEDYQYGLFHFPSEAFKNTIYADVENRYASWNDWAKIYSSYFTSRQHAKDSKQSYNDLSDFFAMNQRNYYVTMNGYAKYFDGWCTIKRGVLIQNLAASVAGLSTNIYAMVGSLAFSALSTYESYDMGKKLERTLDEITRYRRKLSDIAEANVYNAFLPMAHAYNINQPWYDIIVIDGELTEIQSNLIWVQEESSRRNAWIPKCFYNDWTGWSVFDHWEWKDYIIDTYGKTTLEAFEDWEQMDDDILYDFQTYDFSDLEYEVEKPDPEETPEYNTPTPCPIDPSGYVYEAVASNRVESATAEIYYRDSDGTAKLWDEAEEYDEINPQTTDSFGEYGWMTPVGRWKVEVTKDGYLPADSTHDPAADADGWLPVPPPQVDVNIGLVSTAAPTVKSVNASADTIQVVFSQYMDIAALENDPSLITVTQGGGQLPVSFTFADSEESPTQPGVFYGRILNITRTGGASFSEDFLTVKVKKEFKNYAGTGFAEDYTAANLEVRPLVASIDPGYLNGITVTAGIERTISVSVTDSCGSAVEGEIVTMTAAYGDLLELGEVTAVTNSFGEAEFTLTGNHFGNELLTFTSSNGVTATAVAKVSDQEVVIRGDADGSGVVDVLDATVIQRKLADFEVGSFNESAACISGEKLNILDATAIQRKLAYYFDPYYIGKDM